MFRIKDHHLHLPHFTFDNSKDLRLLYAIRVTRDLGNKMAMFFLPIFLFSLGYETSQLGWLSVTAFQRGMMVLSVFYILYGILAFFIGVPTGILYRKIGYQRTFVISFLLRALFFICIYFSKQNFYFLIPAVLTDAINAQLFWPGYYSLISRNSLKKNLGKDVGFVNTIIHLLSVISPAISGIIAVLAGLENLFLIGLVLTLVSTFFAFELEQNVTNNSVSYKEFFKWMKESRFRQLAASYTGKYVYDVSIYIWPLYIFLLLGSVDKVGYLYTVSLFIAMLVTYFTGNYIDNHKNIKPFYISGGALSIITALRAQIVSVAGIAFIDLADRLVANVYSVYFDTMFIKRGKGHAVDAFFVYREMIVNIAIVLFWSITLIFFSFFSGWQPLYLFAAIGVLIGLLVKDSKYE